ncbi:MAG: 2-dehydro-3-deoxyphosphogluconate aldolase/4-hydroxy-2-oxoglutarate aldolase [Candidatus Roizmanbacteria bacterium GW2011_GWA2_36_23]|uniref:2-dehydro-3-deoxyphosphogluconate aldolase/4-hydroxy-2-oxoglutarate aldolase n=1 Tax=Candidatus Roizmanbacteria bacterium GW2011_GWA2_36_23 TaxID=1618480 RepID=A0A0G0E821_9BACT|nr:MAG: 2-dehydro-3-deoxyphosphogluconate aldolase/4-hydroxy-2-oxoglutarate aldolase [Candidatus Roizmanbacteria bacterium GW2011_GWA2_36_23]
MKVSDLYQSLQSSRLLPIINGKDSLLVSSVIESLISASLPLIEITLRDNNSLKTLNAIRKKFPRFIIGAGTVIRIEDAKKAIGAGADFLVSPGLSQDIAEYTASHSVPYLPGVSTSTEIQQAYCLGITVLKWFPADLLGGPKMLSVLDGPFGHYGIKFIPTGGINENNFVDYLKLTNVQAVGGSFIIPEKILTQNNLSETIQHVRYVVKLARGSK